MRNWHVARASQFWLNNQLNTSCNGVLRSCKHILHKSPWSATQTLSKITAHSHAVSLDMAMRMFHYASHSSALYSQAQKIVLGYHKSWVGLDHGLHHPVEWALSKYHCPLVDRLLHICEHLFIISDNLSEVWTWWCFLNATVSCLCIHVEMWHTRG